MKTFISFKRHTWTIITNEALFVMNISNQEMNILRKKTVKIITFQVFYPPPALTHSKKMLISNQVI